MTLPFDLSSSRVVVVTIDLHRGHLDQSVATMPVSQQDGDQIIEANDRLLRAMRTLDVPVIHVLTSYRSTAEIAQNRWWSAVAGTDATRSRVMEHQLEGGPGVEIMPPLQQDGDILVSTKKRYDCFVATDLEHVLNSLGAEVLLLTGINTNSCVLATAVAANVRDYAVVVVRDCVGTMDRELHQPALDIVDAAFGWTMTSDEVLRALSPASAPVGS